MSYQSELQARVEAWARTKNFTAPYGILTGEFTSKNGKKFKSVTFGRARTLDASVMIYGPRFVQVQTSRHGSNIFRTEPELWAFLETL